MQLPTSSTSLAWLSGLALWTALAGCEDCPREGCDALSTHATRGMIAGIVASESDVVANDCQECAFAEARVRAWQIDQPATTDAELRAAAMAAPSAEAQAGRDGEYRLDGLSDGPVLVCVATSCFNIEARADVTTTLNVKLVNGISSGFIGVARHALARTDGLPLPLDAIASQ